MSEALRKQIYNNLNLKNTDELIEIWRANDRVEWTEDAFDVVRIILMERLGEVPAQAEPVLEHVVAKPEEEDDDGEPVFYKPREVLWLEKWLTRAAVVAVVATAITYLLQVNGVHRTILMYFRGNMSYDFVAWLIAIFFYIFAVALEGVLYYFSLKALGTILKILMEMEFNSRGVK